MRQMDNAVALALGGATIAYPGTGAALDNDAVPGFSERAGIFLSSAIPFGISGLQNAQFQGLTRLSARDGFGLSIEHSGMDVYTEQQFRLVYGRRLGERLLLGGSAAILRVSAPEYGSATAGNFSLGVLAEPIPGLWLGARISNPVQLELAGASLPSMLRLGAAWKAGSTLILLLETEKDLERKAQVKAGIEYRPVEQLVLRAGIRSDPARLVFGLGYQLKNGLEISSGAEWHTVLGLTPSAMLIWRR